MPIDPKMAGTALPETEFKYTERDVILYALGVGAGARDDELAYVYEGGDLKTLPTFAVIPGLLACGGFMGVLDVNLMMLLHGEHAIRLHRPIPPTGKLHSTAKIAGIYDKGKGALLVVEAATGDENGPLFENTFAAFIRGEGGFGGERGPSGEKNVPPSRPPDAVVETPTLRQQALIYRLTGDHNPLHADPSFAKMAGYDRPILHGLCTYGHVGRAVLHAMCRNEPAHFAGFEARFSGVVYPGETIITEMWKETGKVIVRAKVKERDLVVLTNAAVAVRS